MDFNEYQFESHKTWKENYRNDFTRAILGLCGEAGEVAEKIKKALRDDLPLPKEEIAKELGDSLYYHARVAEGIGYSLEEIAKMNIKKLVDREKRNKIKGSGDNR